MIQIGELENNMLLMMPMVLDVLLQKMPAKVKTEVIEYNCAMIDTLADGDFATDCKAAKRSFSRAA